MKRAPPKRLGRYEVLERIGQGGMAEVFHARLEGAAGVSKQVVIKRVLPGLAADPDFVSKFVTEARVSMTMSHPNVVQVFELGEQDGAYYLVMELVEGHSLEKVLDRAASRGIRTLWPATAVSIATHVCRGLHYAHTRVGEDGRPLRLVHRDVSPENVLLGFDGQIKLSDFGVAKVNLRGRMETTPGIVLGKVFYLSPEQARGEPLDPRTDVFALGVVLFEMLCGRRPVGGATGPAMLQLAEGRLPRPREVNPAVDLQLESVLLRALAHDPRDRYPSAQAFGEALEEWRQRSAPNFRERWMQDLLAYLFREELERSGRTVTLSDEALAGVESLIDPEAAKNTVELEAPELASAPTRQMRRKKPPAPPPTRRGRRLWAAALAGALAVGAGLLWHLVG